MKNHPRDDEFLRYSAHEYSDNGPEINQTPPEFNEVRPDIHFLHLVCRKIDIKKTLYTSYDEKRDLLPLSMEQLNANYCLKIVYILACFSFCKNSEGICYKAINSLLKLREIIPAECLNNPFAHKIYTKYIKELL